MTSGSSTRDEEASLGTWCAGSAMTCLAVTFSLLGEGHANNYLIGVLFLTAMSAFNAMQLGRIKIYGLYFLPFPVASMLLWPALPGTQPDLVAWIPLVIALTSLLIWNGPTMVAIFQTSEASSRNTQSRGTCTDPEPLPGPGSFSRSSLDSYQGVVAYQRTLSWANDPGRPWSRFVVCRTRSTVDSVNSSGRDSESERSISLSEGSLGRQAFDPTLVEAWPTPLPEYEEGLQDRVNGFHASRHGSFRTMSPVCMDG